MNYDYIFTEQEKNILYEELEKIINSNTYKKINKEYDKLINQISINIQKNKLNDPLAISYLLKRNIEDIFNGNQIINNQAEIDLDMLYKLWGSRVSTSVYSDRHIISLINDVLIRSGFISCKILAKTDVNKIPYIYKYNDEFTLNYILLCLLINNKKVYVDLNKNKILEYNKLLSNSKYKCYQPIINKEGIKYYIKDNHEYNIEINGDHLYTLNSFLIANEYNKNDYYKKTNIIEYLNYINNLNINLLDSTNNLETISRLNNELTIKQNDIYKKVKKF